MRPARSNRKRTAKLIIRCHRNQLQPSRRTRITVLPSKVRASSNLTSNCDCSFVVGWTGEITVQYKGQAHQPQPVALVGYQEFYSASWQECRSDVSWPGITYFVVRPKWIATATLIRIRPSLKSSPSRQILRLQDIFRSRWGVAAPQSDVPLRTRRQMVPG